MAFTVTNVIDDDTFEVFPPWRWKEQSGIRVKPAGYTVLEGKYVGFQKIRDKLKSLILGKEVELQIL